MENSSMSFLKLTAAALTIAFGSTVAMAQTATTPVAPKAPTATAPAPAAPAAAATTTAPKKAGQKAASTPEGIACSAEADAKNLHGKERTKFRRACIKGKLAAEGKSATKAPAKKN
jgi:hypothetical protein